MKKILFFLFAAIVLGSILLTSCHVPDLNREREIQGTVVAIGKPFVFNGIEVATLVWQETLDPGKNWDETSPNSQWLFYPSNIVTAALEGKEIKIRYKITIVSAGDSKNAKPLVQILSVEQITQK